MMLLSGCKSKYSDYTSSSGLSSFSLDSVVMLKVLGEVVYYPSSSDSIKVRDFLYSFQICSMRDTNICRNPFVDFYGLSVKFHPLKFHPHYINPLFDRFDKTFPYITYVIRKTDGDFKTIDYLRLYKYENSKKVESDIRSKEKSLFSFSAKDLTTDSTTEDPGKYLHKIHTKKLLSIATSINRSSIEARGCPRVYRVCSIDASSGCIDIIKNTGKRCYVSYR